ncbi:MAG: hypothetical protein QOG08_1379 [Chloroflexota bacterium]|jgi:hypothetical protein|nr:hypothetical protein [Chloroflexota bacterium]
MGASSAEIDQEIRDAREELDETLGVLESRAARGARVYGRIVAAVAVGAAVVVVGVMVYRRRQQKNVVKRFRDVVLQSVRDLPDEMTAKLKKKLPIKVVITDSDEEGSGGNAWSGIAAKIAPTLVGSATGAVMARLRGTPDEAAAAE